MHIKRILNIPNIRYKIFLGVLLIVFLILMIPSDKIIYAKGSGTRIYTIGDFFIAKPTNMINNPIGIGWVLMIVFSIGIILLMLNFKRLFTEKNFFLSTSFIWTIFTLIGVLGASFSIGFVPFRMWTFFGFAAAIVIGFSMVNLLKPIKSKSLLMVILIMFVILVYFTSFSQKYTVNTAYWPEHKMYSPEAVKLYVQMRETLPKWTRVNALCHPPFVVTGFDMDGGPWNEKELDCYNGYFRTALNKSLEDNYNFLRKYNYDYVILDSGCVYKFKWKPELLNSKLQEFLNSSLFTPMLSTQEAMMFKIK